MRKGNQGYIKFDITDKNGYEVTPDNVEIIKFYIGNLNKTFNKESEEVVFDEKEGQYLIYLTQEETNKFSPLIPIQIRIKYTNGDIEASEIYNRRVEELLEYEVL